MTTNTKKSLAIPKSEFSIKSLLNVPPMHASTGNGM